MRQTVDIIGTGNVSYHLAKSLAGSTYPIHHIYSRWSERGQAFLRETAIDATVVSDEGHCFDSQFVLLCVADEAVEEVLVTQTFARGSVIIHCSGALDLTPFKRANISSYGVLYPFQTLTKGIELSMKQVPLFIEAGDPKTLMSIRKLADTVSDRVSEVNSEKRLRLHLAAVFATNFSNAMYHIAEELLGEQGEHFDILRHLVEATSKKALTLGPGRAQTGPAVRGDVKTMQKHLNSLSDPSLKEIYQLISERISQSSSLKS